MRPIHVYWAHPETWSDETLERAWSSLDRGERERAGRFRFADHRRTYVVAHALLRHALSCSAQVEPAAWEFVARDHGRPEVAAPAGAPPLRFSLAHTGGLAACAVALDTDVGLDVEDTARRAPLDIFGQVLAPSEQSSVRSAPVERQGEQFFIYWTLKEAYAKARGLGLTLAFDQIAFDISSTPIRVAFGPACSDDPSRWRFQAWRIGDRHQAALAARAESELCVGLREVQALTS